MAGGMWAPFKELVKVINAAILKKEPNAYYSLEAELKKHKPDFISLLRNPVSMSLMSSLTPSHSLPPPFPPLPPSFPPTKAKDTAHRAKVDRAMKDGIELPNFPNLHSLPQEYINDALLLSDILNLNEVSAIELILAGEQQLP